MSTNAQAVLEEIKLLPPQEFELVWQQVNRMAAATEQRSAPAAGVSDAEFEAALDEVTGCTTSSLQRLLDDRRRDREHDEAWLEARRKERARG